MRIRTHVWIEDDEGGVLFGSGRLQILGAIGECGTMRGAAASLGLSYRGLWARLRNSERRLGFRLVESRRGRGDRAGTLLTPRARRLLVQYQRLLNEVYLASERAYARRLEKLLRAGDED